MSVPLLLYPVDTRFRVSFDAKSFTKIIYNSISGMVTLGECRKIRDRQKDYPGGTK